MFRAADRAFRAAVIAAFMSLYSSGALPQPAPAPGASALTAEQLDQLVAPIALYPDPLIAQILMAATYPLEVVEADRWLRIPANAALKGDALTAALQQQPWDPSVKSLVPFPQLLRMMDSNLHWTEQLGDAFLAQQADVMDAVQRLRQRAQAAGSLASTPQQTVSTRIRRSRSSRPTPTSSMFRTIIHGASTAIGPMPITRRSISETGADIAGRQITLWSSAPASTRSGSGAGAISTGVSTTFASTMIDTNNFTPAMSRRAKSGSTILRIATACPIAIRRQRRISSARPTQRGASPADTLRRRRCRGRSTPRLDPRRR